MPVNKKRAKEFFGDIQALQDGLEFEDFFDNMQSKLSDLISKRGELEGETLRTYIRRITRLLDPEFLGFVDKIFSSYDNTINLVNQHYGDIGTEISRDFAKIQAIEKINLTQLGEYRDSTVRDISKIVRKGIFEGKQHTEIGKDITAIGGKVAGFGNTLARTQVKAHGQESKMEKARLGEVFFHQYVGIIRPDITRRFCLELRQQSDPTFHIRDIRQMRNGQISPVQTYRGGFNCHHDWEPDPFFDAEKYKVSFYSVQDGRKTLTLAR